MNIPQACNCAPLIKISVLYFLVEIFQYTIVFMCVILSLMQEKYDICYYQIKSKHTQQYIKQLVVQSGLVGQSWSSSSRHFTESQGDQQKVSKYSKRDITECGHIISF